MPWLFVQSQQKHHWFHHHGTSLKEELGRWIISLEIQSSLSLL